MDVDITAKVAESIKRDLSRSRAEHSTKPVELDKIEFDRSSVQKNANSLKVSPLETYVSSFHCDSGKPLA